MRWLGGNAGGELACLVTGDWLEDETITGERFPSVAVAVDVVKLAGSEDISAVFEDEVHAWCVHIRLNVSHATEQIWPLDELPERIRFVQDDKEFTLLQLTRNSMEVVRGKVTPAELLTVGVVPTAVVNHVPAADLTARETEQFAGVLEFVSVELFHETIDCHD